MSNNTRTYLITTTTTNASDIVALSDPAAVAVPFRTDSEAAKDAGDRAWRAEYRGDVRSIAQDAIDEYPDDEDAQDEYVEQSVDGCGWVIYTHLNLRALLYSEHDDAYEEIGFENPTWAQMAYCAMLEDVREHLATLRSEREDEDGAEGSPQPEDYVIASCGPLGSRYAVGIVDGSHVGEFDTMEEAEDAIREDAGDAFFPSVWFEDDHGGHALLDFNWGGTNAE